MARDFRIYGQVPRFQLDRRPGRSRLKTRCPKCGKERCFTLYVDTKTGQPVGNEFGRCDHERRCGYDNRPTGKDVGDRELWISNNDVLKAFQISPNNDVTNFIEMKDVLETINPNESNTLFRFLSALWDRNFVESVFRKYMVGTKDLWSWTGSSVFWQIDKNFVCRTGKIMDYEIKEENGIMVDVKRVKDNDYPHVMFFHALNSQDYSLRQCLFGEHLLNFINPYEKINVVESEKTAIICAINRPDRVFMATGGLQNMRPEVMEGIRGRKIVMFPDKGSAIGVWKEKVARDLYGFDISVDESIQEKETVGDGDDYADYVIRKRLSDLGLKNKNGYIAECNKTAKESVTEKNKNGNGDFMVRGNEFPNHAGGVVGQP